MNKLWLELQKMSITEGIEDKGILKSCFMAGSPGSGKTYTIQKIKSGSIEPRMVNTDKISEFMAKELGIKPNDIIADWSLYKSKIKLLTKDQLALYLNSLLPLWIDGTSSSPPSVFRRQGILKSIGYDTCMLWVETSLDIALERNRKRERNVPDEFLIKTYKKIQELKKYYKAEFRYFYEVDTSNDLDNQTVVSLYKKVSSFFSNPVENPIGSRLIMDMKKNKQKYLIDTGKYSIQSLKSLTAGWYK